MSICPTPAENFATALRSLKLPVAAPGGMGRSAALLLQPIIDLIVAILRCLAGLAAPVAATQVAATPGAAGTIVPRRARSGRHPRHRLRPRQTPLPETSGRLRGPAMAARFAAAPGVMARAAHHTPSPRPPPQACGPPNPA